MANPVNVLLTAYYRGGLNVPDTTLNASIPTSGPISLDDFHGASKAIGTFTMKAGVDPGTALLSGYANSTAQSLHFGSITFNSITVYTIIEAWAQVGAGRSFTLRIGHASIPPPDSLFTNLTVANNNGNTVLASIGAAGNGIDNGLHYTEWQWSGTSQINPQIVFTTGSSYTITFT